MTHEQDARKILATLSKIGGVPLEYLRADEVNEGKVIKIDAFLLSKVNHSERCTEAQAALADKKICYAIDFIKKRVLHNKSEFGIEYLSSRQMGFSAPMVSVIIYKDKIKEAIDELEKFYNQHLVALQQFVGVGRTDPSMLIQN